VEDASVTYKTSEKFWEKIVDSMMPGLVVVSSRGIILAVNQAMEEMTGYNRDELIGRPCALIKTDSCFAATINGGKTCELFQSGCIRRRKGGLVKKDGGMVHVLKNATLLKDQDGQTVAVETFTDITEMVAQERVIYRLRRELNREDGLQGIIGRSPAMVTLFSLINSAAQSEAPTIIFGESGTGKELVAAAIHRLSPRSQGPYIKVNSAALHESLLESELFGHVRGAFTGADRTRVGRFEAAHGGDIFLDEIGDLPLTTQAKLLRVLQEKVIERVGDHTPIPVDVRLISATNKNLGQLLAKGQFREDLFYRVNVIPIQVPPLRDRLEDIPLLAEAFIERSRLKTKKRIRGISKEALEKLMSHQWPGNVRELINAIEFAFVLCPEGNILPEHLPNLTNPKSLHQSNSHPKTHISQEQSKEVLLKALAAAGGNKAEAARILGVSRVTLWKRLKKYNLQQALEEEPEEGIKKGKKNVLVRI
jgi:two-component system response regulator HydG